MIQYQKWYWTDNRILVTDNASVQVDVFNCQELKDKYRADALIYALYVNKPCRKRGIGKALLEQAEQLARDKTLINSRVATVNDFADDIFRTKGCAKKAIKELSDSALFHL